MSVLVPPWETPTPLRMVCGCDPGAKGGFSVVDANKERLLFSVPMPIYKKTVNKTQRARTDMQALEEFVEHLVSLGCELFVGENTGAGFGAGGKELGENTGMIKMACHLARLRQEWVPVLKWKKKLIVPADKKEACYRAQALFPRDYHMLMGPNGGRHDGKAESAMVALYGCREVLGGI